MKKRKGIISIFVLIISVIACCFMFAENKINSTYAADIVAQDCFYLLGQDGYPYLSNTAVGKIEGTGKFIVGEPNVPIKAIANSNFQIVGWQIIYAEQENKTEFVNTQDLVNNSKEIELTAKDGVTKIKANISFVSQNNIYESSTFTLANVFENLTIRPVFDHTYYLVEITEFAKLSALYNQNQIQIGENILFYNTSTVDGEVTSFTNTYIQMQENVYYYGNLYLKSGKYYTIHKTLDDAQTEQEIDYTTGAFRVGDKIDLELNVNLTADIKTSTNIDLLGSSVVGDVTQTLTKNNTSEDIDNSYKISQDEFLRTRSLALTFNVIPDANKINTVDVSYHNLYVVDLSISLDGSTTHNELQDIFGTTEIKENEILSNISIYNFYARTTTNNLQFLVKSSQNNNSKSFGISCAQTISQTIDGANYKYYNFVNLDGGYSLSSYYANISQNIQIVIEYSSSLFEVDFVCAEYIEDSNGVVSLNAITGNVLEPIQKKRGETVILNQTLASSIENTGYRFKGYAFSLNGDVEDNTSYKIDKQKPQGATIYMCFEKLEYKIVFANFNKVTIGESTPLNAVSFVLTNGANVSSQTLYAADLVDENGENKQNVELDLAIKIDGTIEFSHILNSGFQILGYSTKDAANVTDADYFTTFTLNAKFIEENNVQDQITIYVYEDLIKYTLTYYIEKTLDSKLQESVIMANINAESVGATIEKYDLSNQLISETNNNLTATVAKIIISNLKLNDQVKLSSVGITTGAGEDSYSYAFNWFTEEGSNNTTLSYSVEDNVYTHTETISKSRNIKVVYSMPSTKVFITVDDEFANNPNFAFNFKVENNNEKLVADVDNTNVFTIEVGLKIKITISDIAFGYNFVGYIFVEMDSYVSLDTLSFEYVTKVGVNTIQLDFTRIEYHFIFSQYGGGLNGNIATINGKGYAVLDVDNTEAVIEKPVGYYVSKVTIANNQDYAEALSENNDFRQNADIKNYIFKIERADFISIVTNYGVQNDQTITEVDVRLDYSIFTYYVKVAYGITNPKGNASDLYVTFPAIKLEYVFDGETYMAVIDNSQEKTIMFINIPYGSKATISLAGEATSGFSLSGWTYDNGDLVSQDEYKHSLEYLIIEQLHADKEFIYSISYNAYYINVVNVSEQGNPEVKVGNILSQDRKITLYDQLEIVPNAYRESGYVFSKITYKVPVYSEYSYNADSWSTDYSRLYVRVGNSYKLNTNGEYNSNTHYYVYSEKTVVCLENLVDSSFLLSNYALDADGKTITFNVEYKLLELTIVNNITEKGKRTVWTLLGRGSSDARIEYTIEDLADFTISAKDAQGEDHLIQEGMFVTFYDTITVNVAINKTAKNIDGTVYDLSLGLILNRVKIGDQTIAYTETAVGEYTFTFYVGQFLPADSEQIEISYQLYVQAKTVNVTTIVSESTTFYQNVQLHIDASKYNYESSFVVSENNASFVEHELQFLAKTDVFATLTSTNYKENFVIAGVLIYCNNSLISEEDYAKYGITLNDDNSVTARLMFNLKAVFIVQPKITYNDGPTYTRTFMCDNTGTGIAQKLTIGTTDDFDIQVAELLVNSISIKYVSTAPNSYPTDSVTNVGRYNVLLSFVNTADTDWLKEIQVAEDIVLIIQPKDVYITYDPNNLTAVKRVYDGTSDYNVTNIYKYLIITDNSSFNVKYSDIISDGGSDLALDTASAYISSSGKDFAVKKANENIYYNLYVYDMALKKTTFNNNFKLKNSDLIIANFVQITQREIKLQNVYIYNKVYDGSDKAVLVSTENITISNTISGDDIAINIERLNPRFENGEIGTNKKVVMDATAALVGKDVGNYYIDVIQTQGVTIYPYSLSVEIKGVGTVEVINKRGLTEQDKVGLIPLNATLIVNPIYADTNEYVSIYNRINDRLKGNNEFAIGYEIALLLNGEEIPVDNNLYLSIPSVKNLTGTYFLTGQHNGAISYTYENGKMLIDLSQIGEDVNCVFLTRTKILLKVWQVVLIVIGILLLITAAVLTFIIIRKRKIDRDSVHEKI